MGISGIPAYIPYVTPAIKPYVTPDYSPVVAKIKAIIDAQTAAILQPIDGLRQSSASYDIKISSYGQIQSDLSVLESTAELLTGSNAFSRYSAKSTNPSIFTSYAQGGAIPGVYTVAVSQLAQGQVLLSAAQLDPSIGGDLPATVTFRFRNGDSKAVTINATDSLSTIAASINQANIGIAASVISDGAGFRLMLKGASGASNAFSIDVNGNSALSNLLFYADGVANSAMSQTMAAQDSQLSVNGNSINGNGNVITGFAGGLTLNLNGVGQARVTVYPDITQISNAVQSFVNAYNIAQSDIASNMAGALSGDQTLTGVSTQLTSDLATGQSSPGGSPNSLLSQIGITRNPDGTLSFNADVFQTAYSQNPDGIAHLFTDNGNGLADQIARQIHDVIQPGGNISSTIQQLLLKIQNNQQMESKIQDNAFQNMESSARHYVQLLAMMIIKQIMEYFLQFTQQQQQSNLPLTPPKSANQPAGSLSSSPVLDFQF